VVPQDLTRVFLNLFGNGFYAAKKRQLGGAGSAYRPTLTVSTRDLGEAVEIRVRDNGTGITPEVGPSCSSRSSPPSRPAKAPVLACRSVTTSSRSSMAVRLRSRAKPGSFTEFTVRLPRRPACGVIEGR
jgi:Signal transduction histidine kinase